MLCRNIVDLMYSEITNHNIDFPQLVTKVSSYGIEMEDPYTRTRNIVKSHS